MVMKNIIKTLLAALIPLTAFAQNQGDDLGLGQGATAIVGRTNEARASTAGTSGKANYIGLTAAGDVYVRESSASGLGDFGAQMGIAPIFVVADAAEALSTTTVIVATAHVARVNDYVQFTAGTAANIGVWRRVLSVATDSITVASAFPATVAATDAFSIYRPRLNDSIRAEDTPIADGDLGIAVFARNMGSSGFTSTGGSGDHVMLITDADNRVAVNAFGANPTNFWSACSASNTGTSDTAIKAAVASNRIYVTSMSCFNTAAVASSFEIKDGSTVMYAGGISNSTLAGVAYWEHTFGVPLRGSVNTALNFDMATNATATTCCAAGFTSTN